MTQLKAVKTKSKNRKDVLHIELETLQYLAILKTHDICISRYTSDYHIEKYFNTKRKEQPEMEAPHTEVTCRSSSGTSFVCSLFCGELCALEKDPNKRNWRRKVFLCKTSDRSPNNESCKEYLLNSLRVNSTKWSHSNNSSAEAGELFECVWSFCRVTIFYQLMLSK